MSLIITKGYLINRQEYNTFDEIITFINEHDLKFVCYCHGLKKINSKNARNLDYGNFIEFEFFYSPNKISKLKTATTINELNNENKKKLSLTVLNEYLYKNEFKKIYAFYQQCILYMEMGINDFLLTVYIFVKLFSINGLGIVFNSCNKCGEINNELNINFNNCFSYCVNCYDQKYSISSQSYKLLYELFNNQDIDLYTINEFDVKELKKIIKLLNYSLYKNAGIFIENIKNFL